MVKMRVHHKIYYYVIQGVAQTTQTAYSNPEPDDESLGDQRFAIYDWYPDWARHLRINTSFIVLYMPLCVASIFRDWRRYSSSLASTAASHLSSANWPRDVAVISSTHFLFTQLRLVMVMDLVIY
jgi:hypothetical protein